jgi:hypothetical protein
MEWIEDLLQKAPGTGMQRAGKKLFWWGGFEDLPARDFRYVSLSSSLAANSIWSSSAT